MSNSIKQSNQRMHSSSTLSAAQKNNLKKSLRDICSNLFTCCCPDENKQSSVNENSSLITTSNAPPPQTMTIKIKHASAIDVQSKEAKDKLIVTCKKFLKCYNELNQLQKDLRNIDRYLTLQSGGIAPNSPAFSSSSMSDIDDSDTTDGTSTLLASSNRPTPNGFQLQAITKESNLAEQEVCRATLTSIIQKLINAKALSSKVAIVDLENQKSEVQSLLHEINK